MNKKKKKITKRSSKIKRVNVRKNTNNEIET